MSVQEAATLAHHHKKKKKAKGKFDGAKSMADLRSELVGKKGVYNAAGLANALVHRKGKK